MKNIATYGLVFLLCISSVFALSSVIVSSSSPGTSGSGITNGSDATLQSLIIPGSVSATTSAVIINTSFTVMTPPIVQTTEGSLSDVYFTTLYHPIITGSAYGIYTDNGFENIYAFYDDGLGHLRDTITTSHIVGSINYATGLVMTIFDYNDVIFSITYNHTAIPQPLFVVDGSKNSITINNETSIGNSLTGTATSKGILMNAYNDMGIGQEPFVLDIFNNMAEFTSRIDSTKPGTLFQLDSRNTYGMFKIYRRENGTGTLRSLFSITDNMNINIGAGGGLRENVDRTLFWGVPLTNTYDLIRFDNSANEIQFNVSIRGDVWARGNVTSPQYNTPTYQGVTASGTSCTITRITGGIITGATCI
jgi:hypothetical protein